MGLLGCGGDLSLAGEPMSVVQAPALEPATLDEATRVAIDYVTAVETGDRAAAASFVAGEHFMELGLSGQTVPTGALEAASRSNGVSDAVADEHLSLAKAGTTFRVVGISAFRGTDWVTVGLVHPSGAADQIKLRVAKVDGEARIVDVWTLTSGMSRTEDAARVFGLIAGTDPDAEAVLKIQEQARLGNFDAVLKLVKSAPDPVAGRKDVLILAADAARRVDVKKHDKAVQALLEAHPEEPAARIRATLAAQVAGDHAAAAEHFMWLQANVGPDGYLFVVTSAAFLAAGDAARAREFVDNAVELEPRLLEAWVQLALVAAVQGDDTAVERALIKLKTRFGVQPSMFSGAPYEALRATEGFRRWAASAE